VKKYNKNMFLIIKKYLGIPTIQIIGRIFKKSNKDQSIFSFCVEGEKRDSEISKVLNGWYELGKALDQESDENASCDASHLTIYHMLTELWI